MPRPYMVHGSGVIAIASMYGMLLVVAEEHGTKPATKIKIGVMMKTTNKQASKLSIFLIII